MSNIDKRTENDKDAPTKRVVIHTGPGKTGSSAIQAWLARNHKFLAGKGVLYPVHPVAKTQISSGNLKVILTQNQGEEALKPGNDWFVDVEKVKALLEEFYASDAKVLLLSSEFFFHRIVDIEKAIPEAEFIAYIRNPVELLESNYNQGVKRHGNIKKFSAPKSLDKYFWQYLTNVFKRVKANKIFLRPYDERLMVGGNIVTDVLAVIGLEVDVENKRINPSFTFSSLEFKRLLNYFELGTLEPQLDVALQGCTLGTPVYSLMDKNDFERLNKQSCQAMQVFIEKYQQNHLLPLLQNFQNVDQKIFRNQNANLRELSAIAEYLHNKTQPLFYKLKALVALHQNLLVDNQIIYEVFDVTPNPDNKLSESDKKLLTHFDAFSVEKEKHGNIAYNLSCYFSSIQQWDSAATFAKVAYLFNTEKTELEQHFNKVQIQKNLHSNRACTVNFKQTWRSKVKSSLKLFKRIVSN